MGVKRDSNKENAMNAQWQTKITITLIFLAINLCLPMSAMAKGSFPGVFSNSYGFSIGCTYCHPNSDTKSFNFYGSDFRNVYTSNDKNASNAFATIEPLDSDNDGFSNLEEITAQTLPYDASDYPTTAPVCTDSDIDGFAIEGGDCGPIDCNDNDPLSYPGGSEYCSDGEDNDCNGRTDCLDNSCSSDPSCLTCTDLDTDYYAIEGGDCGPTDCNDGDLSVNPGAVELCNDGSDNDCDGLSDCQDADCNGDSACAGICIPEATREKGKKCRDGIDNDCDGLADAEDSDCARTKGGGKGKNK